MISIVGLGKAGKALLRNFIENDIEIESVYDKDEISAKKIAGKYNVKFQSLNSIKSKVIFICVPDSSIQEVSEKLPAKDFHIHLSGYLPSSVLSSNKKLAFHPNTPLNENVSLKNVVIDLEGEVNFGKTICEQLGAKSLEVSTEEKKKLHLSAVINSNFFLALMYISKKIFPKNWEEISELLVFNTYNNILQKGFKKSLTGPVQRDDIEVINKEREIFSKYFSQSMYDEFIKVLKEIKDA